MNNTKIYALGGLDESGKNLYCIEIDGRMFVVNCGIKRPDDSQFGVDYVIPDFKYLIENKNRISAVIITHFHDDMMDGVPHLLREINVDVYAPKLCAIYLREKLMKEKIFGARIHELPRYGETVIDGVTITSFGLSHGTPDAIGISLSTPKGQIVIAEQFVVDFDMHDKGYESDIGAIAEIGKKGVLCALVESSYSDFSGFTAPKHRITNLIKPIFENTDKRIIVTVYAQNYLRIKEVINLAKDHKRKFFIYDEELRDIFALGVENGYYQVPQNIEVKKNNFSNDDENIVIIVSGNGAKLFKKMHKIAINEDPLIELRDTDTVIITSPIVSGTTKDASAMENDLYVDNVHIYKLNPKEVLSTHPSAEDMKMMLYLLKPKYFIPVMGDYRNFIQSANLALEAGFTPDRVIILDNGQIASIVDGKLTSCNDFVEPIGDVMIGSQDNRNIASFVLKDRESLSTDGVIVVGIAIDFKTKEIIAGPDIQSRGVIYVKDSEYLIKNIGKMVVDTIVDKVDNREYDNLETRIELREAIGRYVFRETGKRPMILPAIIEINMP